jgi:hypothetical protein
MGDKLRTSSWKGGSSVLESAADLRPSDVLSRVVGDAYSLLPRDGLSLDAAAAHVMSTYVRK